MLLLGEGRGDGPSNFAQALFHELLVHADLSWAALTDGTHQAPLSDDRSAANHFLVVIVLLDVVSAGHGPVLASHRHLQAVGQRVKLVGRISPRKLLADCRQGRVLLASLQVAYLGGVGCRGVELFLRG